MSFQFKNKDEMVLAVIERINERIPEDLDFTTGSVLRTLIEAIMMEIDLQYWQMEQVYNNAFIDTSYGVQLDRLVAILGIERLPKTKAQGYVTFSRSTPADMDYLIPQGTVVETLANEQGVSISYMTTETVRMLEGEMEVTAKVECMEEGTIGNIAQRMIKVINNPPLGIEHVTNKEAISSGYDGERDEELRERAKNALETKGFSTINAIKFSIFSIPGIRNVRIYDMFRGVGTIDVLILGDTVPISSNIFEEVVNTVEEVKAAGIDIRVAEAELKEIDIDIKLYIRNGYNVSDVEDDVKKSIKEYIDNLDIGEKLIVNELYRYVMDNELVEDMEIYAPESNIIAQEFEVIRTGNINLT